MPLNRPDPFLEIRVHDLESNPGLTALCAGYEANEWRASQLARHLIGWLPFFALSHREQESFGLHNCVELMARAAERIYNTRTASQSSRSNRGEIGELLLHIAVSEVFETVPAICKLYHKDSANNTVKGFDAVHVVVSGDALELWLGEVKFYKKITSAIRDVVKELDAHTNRDYLRGEFASITDKIDDSWPHAARLKKLLHRNTSLDEIFDCIAIPVLLAFESDIVKAHKRLSDEFKTELVEEVRRHHTAFCSRNLPSCVRIHLFLLPMGEKERLVKEFDKRLTACQLIGS